jgi:hypothetical protein
MNYGEHFNFGRLYFASRISTSGPSRNRKTSLSLRMTMSSNLGHFNTMAKAHERNLTESGDGQPTNSQCAACTASCHIR